MSDILEYSISSLEELEKAVKEIAPIISKNNLLLEGDLGAGKTTFTQYLLQEFGYTESVTSPTYSIVNEYLSPLKKVYHFDLYRLESLEEAYDIGIEDYLHTSALCIIEWPEIIMPIIDENYHKITIFIKDNSRTLRLKI